MEREGSSKVGVLFQNLLSCLEVSGNAIKCNDVAIVACCSGRKMCTK